MNKMSLQEDDFRNQNIADRIWELQIEIDILKEIYKYPNFEDFWNNVNYENSINYENIQIQQWCERTILCVSDNIDYETQIKIRIIAQEYRLLVSYQGHENDKKRWE